MTSCDRYSGKMKNPVRGLSQNAVPTYRWGSKSNEWNAHKVYNASMPTYRLPVRLLALPDRAGCEEAATSTFSNVPCSLRLTFHSTPTIPQDFFIVKPKADHSTR